MRFGSPLVAHSESGAGAGVVDRSALIREARAQREITDDLVAGLRDGTRADVAAGARGLIRDLAAQHDRDARDRAPVELDDAAEAHGAEHLAAHREVRLEIAPDAEERLRASGHAAFAKAEDRTTDEAVVLREADLGRDVAVREPDVLRFFAGLVGVFERAAFAPQDVLSAATDGFVVAWAVEDRVASLAAA